MQKSGYFLSTDEMRELHEQTLLDEIRKRDNKIQSLYTVIAGLVALDVIMLILILFFR